MKIAWLVKKYEDSEWEISFSDPGRYAFDYKKIVWMEVAEDNKP